MADYQYHIETYTMPFGVDTWQTEDIMQASDDEAQVYNRWQAIVKEVKRDYPLARMRRTLKRRTVKQAMGDRESAICSREWKLPNGEGCYRVTMYVTRKAA